jgi:hypothetical protein
VRKRRAVPRLRQREATLDELEQALRRSEVDLADAEAMIGPLAEAVREADRLDADIALGRVEESAARAVQNEARAALRRVVDQKANAGKAAEALTVRALVVVQAEQERLQETTGQELSQVDAELARLDELRRAVERERTAIEIRYAEAWQVIEESRRRFDPAAAAAHAQRLNAEQQMVMSAVRGGTVGLLPAHLQARAEQERERLARESQESLERRQRDNVAEHAARGITLNAGA